MTLDKKLIAPLIEAAMANGVTVGDAVEIGWMQLTSGAIDYEALRRDGVLGRIFGAGQKIADDPINGPKLSTLLTGVKP